ncbi:hypothetical protein M501DRAFT_967668 [Patellaria atrata CBS 101060]|uniref:Formin GTPase-binding domain-containing protein n=1 Tax=Patellaria atrata CBS 101060 TaxID=1346257 RepID=A0A9P4SH95_9PEZI|nr:hypothetical protein M501DRAFT_967668 [Patellaria atrata CBS 101060]
MNNVAVPRGDASPERPGHKRNKSASVLKSILPSKNNKWLPSDGTSLISPQYNSGVQYGVFKHPTSTPMLPPDPPASNGRVLGEIYNQSVATSPRKSTEQRPLKQDGVNKVASGSRSLEVAEKTGAEERTGRALSKSNSRDKSCSPVKMKKTKSSTSIAGMFIKSKPSKETKEGPKDKENTTPPRSGVDTPHTPIWAQFATQQFPNTSTTTIPLNDRISIDDEIARYTPQDYSPSKQRNFYNFEPEHRQQKERPRSDHITTGISTPSFIEVDLHKSSKERPISTYRGPSGDILKHRRSEDRTRSRSRGRLNAMSNEKFKFGLTLSKWRNEKTEDSPTKDKEPDLNPEEVDAAFESVLDSRNIPENMRPKMRSLTTKLKAEFIKQNKVEELKLPRETSKFTLRIDTTSKRPTLGRSARSANKMVDDDPEDIDSTDTRQSRPRSRTFTFSKSDSPSKQSRFDTNNTSAKSFKPSDVPKSPSAKSFRSSSTGPKPSFLHKAPKPAVPEEFVSYLRKIQKPELVEVGKIHKLRLLLRNETVIWVDTFIQQGGMTEIVNLLHRIMQVEWREEHEDALLHEALLCLKGLCTTDRALRKLCELESTLFPALVAMLFDDEHKGPSEFTTRGIIMSLLFMHLCAAPIGQRPDRARMILSYLSDPKKPEAAQPLNFILEMHTPRPYRVWCREVVNVCKEVFWIFLHHLNVVPLPGSTDSVPLDTAPNTTRADIANKSYMDLHFPQPRPPVPAAPYVGGVEWDATNYMATHIDLLNGLLASLPTACDRNALRAELRASGFEKVMGDSLRACKEKFYGHIHDGLRTWVAAAVQDGWEVKDVRMGEKKVESPKKSPRKGGRVEKPPQIEAPKMELKDWSLGIGGKM